MSLHIKKAERIPGRGNLLAVDVSLAFVKQYKFENTYYENHPSLLFREIRVKGMKE